jgi:hypothetical protein
MNRGAWVRIGADVNGGFAYGKVSASGKQTFTVRWENGTSNRFRQGDWRISPVSTQALVEELEKSARRMTQASPTTRFGKEKAS